MAIDTAKPYTYPQLETETSYRVLVLEPGTGDEPLAGNLLEIQDLSADLQMYDAEEMDMFGKPKYDHAADFFKFEALSYVWGPRDLTSTLRCSNGTIALTASLDAALRHVRLREKERFVWADGVCINQDDTKERGHQVRLMGDIYARAERVLIWLGLDKRREARGIFSVALKASQEPFVLDSSTVRDAMSRLADCDWFSRLWVVQEFLLSRSATFLWGTEFLDYDSLRRPLQHWIATSGFGFARWVALKSVFDLSFMQVLSLTRELKCSDERDRIYAIQGLPYRGTMSRLIAGMTPDYDVSVQPRDLYFEVAKQCFEHGQPETLLSQVCQIKPLTLFTTSPSWLPDWNSGAGFEPFPGCVDEQQSGETPAASIQGHVLSIWGSETDHFVQAVGGALCLDPATNIDLGIVDFWQNQVQPLGAAMSRDEYLMKEVSFLQTLMCQQWRGHVSWPTLSALLFGAEERVNHKRPKFLSQASPHDVQWMLSSLEHSVRSSSPVIPLFSDTIDMFGADSQNLRPPQMFWRRRKLFRTTGHLFGLGPTATQEGDRIVQLHQCAHLAVLRGQNQLDLRFVGLAWMPQKPEWLGQNTVLYLN